MEREINKAEKEFQEFKSQGYLESIARSEGKRLELIEEKKRVEQ